MVCVDRSPANASLAWPVAQREVNAAGTDATSLQRIIDRVDWTSSAWSPLSTTRSILKHGIWLRG